MDRWVIMNTKKKMKLSELIKWFGYNCTIIKATRYSYRGAVEQIYIIGALGSYVRDTYDVGYVSDTGNGYGGKGTLKIEGVANYINGVFNSGDKMGSELKRTVWVFK